MVEDRTVPDVFRMLLAIMSRLMKDAGAARDPLAVAAAFAEVAATWAAEGRSEQQIRSDIAQLRRDLDLDPPSNH